MQESTTRRVAFHPARSPLHFCPATIFLIMCLSSPLRRSSQALSVPSNASKTNILPPTNTRTSINAIVLGASKLSSSAALPSRDTVISLIKSNRWWDPALGTAAPLASLLSHNSSQAQGWLRKILFPDAAEDVSKYDERLTLAYLLTVAEVEGLALPLCEAWGETFKTAYQTRARTISQFAYHPILISFPAYQESVKDIKFLFSLFPSGCLGKLGKKMEYERLALVFLDAALFRRGQFHGKDIKRLFLNCHGSTIGITRNHMITSLFSECIDPSEGEEKMHFLEAPTIPVQQAEMPSDPRRRPTEIRSDNAILRSTKPLPLQEETTTPSTTKRAPLGAINGTSSVTVTSAFNKPRRKRQVSSSILQPSSKKSMTANGFWAMNDK
mmetsp:Transcript_36891/g.80749  ORF Transcript_36891/g.80749 Transcript_36891/m.80749 type:complete len:384 (+) Transcript_36891:1477-2628(+)